VHPQSIIYISYVSLAVLAAAVAVLGLLQVFLSKSGTGTDSPCGRRRPRSGPAERDKLPAHLWHRGRDCLRHRGARGNLLRHDDRIYSTSGGINLLFAFETVVIGGIGSLWGTLVGGIALGVAQQFGAPTSIPSYQVLAGNLLFLVVLAVRPEGLFGRKTALA